MSDWQPARVAPAQVVALAHKQMDTILKGTDPRHGKIIRVRPYIPDSSFVEMTRRYGCEATQYFETHPDDVLDGEYGIHVWCEHQIYVD